MKHARSPFPGRSAHILLTLCALLLTLCVAMTCLAWQCVRLTSDRSMYYALTEKSMPLQMERIDVAINTLSAQYHFAPETALGAVTQASLQDYWMQVVDWSLGLLGSEPDYTLPFWDHTALVDAVRQDEEFQHWIPAVDRRNVARDTVAAQLGSTIERTMMPLRTPVIAKGMQMLAQRVDLPGMVSLLGRIPVLLGGLSLLLCLAMLLLGGRCPMRSLAFIGSGLLAGSGLTALVMLCIHLLDVAASCALVSDVLATLACALGRQLGLQLGMVCLALAAAGMVMLIAHQVWLKRTGREKA